MKAIKKPKSYVFSGSIEAQLIKSAKAIENQEQLDLALSQVKPEVGAAWLQMIRPHLRFEPQQFIAVEKELELSRPGQEQALETRQLQTTPTRE